jgi:TerC family integral membrane protein
MWSLFAAFVVVALLVDFLAMSRQGAHRVSMREAAIWSLIWVAVSFAFLGWLWWYLDAHSSRQLANAKALEFLTGYLVEKALAVDNIFVFLMVFTYFAVPAEFQKRVLMIGILGALVLRAVMILLGAWLITQFHWVLYIFGAFLVFTGAKMWWAAGQEPDLEANPALKWLRSRLKIAPDYNGERFTTTIDGVRYFTPLFVVIALIGIVDIIFAVDSHPRDLRHHDGPVHRADVQRVRHPRPARDVLPARRHARALPPALVRPGDRARVHRHEDAVDRYLQDPGRLVPGVHRRRAGRDHAPVAADSAKGRDRRGVSVQGEAEEGAGSALAPHCALAARLRCGAALA